ncbi:hypothetical protein SNE40_020566 [Patella caerulea]|uniref:SOCS box domain-containing protein n=1 Tax=Patella caerulea TaxID=87958 RepID=A0AAN8PB10_PATCE
MSGCEPEEWWRKSQGVKEKLREAVNKNDTSEVERIIQHYVKWGHDEIWKELCEVALKNRCLPIVELLLSSEKNSISFVDFKSNTQLIKAAIKSDFIDGVKYLQSKGIPLYFAHSMSRYNLSALTECVINNSVEVLKYLLELKYLDKNPDKEETLLMTCCHELKIESLKILLKSELINTINQQSVNCQCSALHFCMGGRHHVCGREQRRVLECVKLLMEAGADVNLQDINGTTPIQMAAELGMVTTVIYLAERGVNLDLENKQGNLLHSLADSRERADSYDECIQLLITKGVDINKLNSSNETPLYLAACRVNEEMVKSLINSHCNVNIKVGGNKESVLLASIRPEHTTIAEILIQAGCDVNTADKNGVTPLMKCVEAGNNVLIKQLIEQGGLVNAKDKKRRFVLDYLFRSYHHQSTSADIVRIIIEAGADINKCSNLLCKAIKRRDYKTASLLIEHGIDVNTVDKNGDNPLALASGKGKLELVKLLISKDCDINHQNREGQTALHKAIEVSIFYTSIQDNDQQTPLSIAVGYRNMSITEVLLTAGADIDHCDESRQTPLMIAVKNHDTDIANVLLKAGAVLKPRDELGRNAMYLAAFYNNPLVLDVLLEYSNVRSEAESIVNATDMTGKTPFMVAAEKGYKTMVEKLLMAGCNINLQDHGGKTALMCAVDNDDVTVLSLLLQNGADYNICDNNGKTALMVAVEKQKDGHCKEWIKYGASVNHVDNNGNTALLIAVKDSNRGIVNSLLKAGADVNLSDNNGQTALVTATVNGSNWGIVNSLLKAGADVNLSDNNGQTALVTATESYNRSILKCLLKAGADVNQSNNHGTTALMAAARTCNRSILECLLNAGADVNKTDTDGRSAIHYIMVGSRGSGRKWINCLKLLLINKCHVSLDTPGEDGKTLFQWLLKKNKEDLIWYLVTENCSLKDLNLPKVKYKFQFPDMLMLSKILFGSGAPKREINVIILIHFFSTGLSEDERYELLNFFKSRTLQSRCRREIRNCIGPGISSKITQVGLPQCLQDYVVMKDLIPEEYFTLLINDEDDLYDSDESSDESSSDNDESNDEPDYYSDNDESNDEPDYYSDNDDSSFDPDYYSNNYYSSD